MGGAKVVLPSTIPTPVLVLELTFVALEEEEEVMMVVVVDFFPPTPPAFGAGALAP